MPPLPVIFCFSGQGSQYYGMGAGLRAENPVFRHWLEAGDALVAQRHGFSLLAETHAPGHGPTQPFDRLEASHPALFLVQYALAKTLQDRGIRPDALLGVSLGEFVAQAVAGMLPFETALTAVADQPARFRATCPPGGMIAVLGPPALAAEVPLLAERAELAGTTSPNHFILAALAHDLEAIEAELRHRQLAFQRLPVPFAFHSRFVEPARESCLEAGARLRRDSGFWPVWSCCTAGPTGTAAPDLMWRVIRQPMNVQATLAAIEAQGGAVYVDLSPSGTLAAVLRQALPAHSPSRLVGVLSPFGGDVQRLDKAVAALRHLAEPVALR